VVVVVTLAIEYSDPAFITMLSATEPMFVWEEVRNTVVAASATVGRPAVSTNDTNTAAYDPPSAGSSGGATVTNTPTAIDGTTGAAVTARGKD
jgi:hypothetical protein